MPILHNLNVTELRPGKYSIRIDGTPIQCRAVDIHMDTESVPTAVLEVPTTQDFDALVAAEVAYHPATVAEAHAILRGALLADKELRDAWIASIASVFEGDEDLGEEGDEDEYLEPEDVAEEVLARIIGMEM